MSYLQIVVLLLTVFYSNQVLGEQSKRKLKLENLIVAKKLTSFYYYFCIHYNNHC